LARLCNYSKKGNYQVALVPFRLRASGRNKFHHLSWQRYLGYHRSPVSGGIAALSVEEGQLYRETDFLVLDSPYFSDQSKSLAPPT